MKKTISLKVIIYNAAFYSMFFVGVVFIGARLSVDDLFSVDERV